MPVVPLQPRKPMSSCARRRLRKSQSKSWGVNRIDEGTSHLQPETRALAEGDKLCRLEVRPSEASEIAVHGGELGEAVDDDGQLVDDQVETLAQEDQVGVAEQSGWARVFRALGHITRRRAEVDDRRRGGRNGAEDVDVRHDIVPPSPLLLRRELHLHRVERQVGLHLLDRLVRDGQAL